MTIDIARLRELSRALTPDHILWEPKTVNDAHFCGMMRSSIDGLLDELEADRSSIYSVFDVIAHGDEEHRRWLKEKLEEHFRAYDATREKK